MVIVAPDWVWPVGPRAVIAEVRPWVRQTPLTAKQPFVSEMPLANVEEAEDEVTLRRLVAIPPVNVLVPVPCSMSVPVAVRLARVTLPEKRPLPWTARVALG